MAAADTAKLVASLSLDDSAFKRGITSANKGIGNLEKTLNNVGKRGAAGLGNIASNLTKIGTVAAIGGIGLLAKSVQQASDLNEQLSKTAVVFGKASDEVIAFSKTTAEGLGLSQAAALEGASSLGNMFKTIGLADDKSADFSKTLVTLAADMASFNNEDPSEMLDRLRAGLSGESEPLKRFGVLLNEARVKEEAYATGIAKVGDELTEAQKVQARYSLILKDSKVQQGDFARTSGGLANQIRILKASFADTGATIGTALLPKITELAVKLNKAIKENQPAIKEFAEKLPGAFDKVASFAERIPWAAIGSGLEKAAFFADKLFDTFLSLPPEVQGTLIALAGLNKLPGGAITGIVSELGKGLIKGVLGINAGVVNVNAARVGGVGVGGPTPVPAGGIGSKVATVVTAVLAPAAGFLIATEIAKLAGSSVSEDPVDNLERVVLGLNAIVTTGESEWTQTNRHLQDMLRLEGKDAVNSSNLLRSSERNESIATTNAQKVAAQIAAGDTRSELAISGLKAATTAGLTNTASAARSAAEAIRAKKLSVAITNAFTAITTVSARETIKTQTTHKQWQKFIQ